MCQSVLASLGMGSLNQSAVQDLCDANTAVERLKAEPFFGIKLPHISIQKVRWATVQDSQGAFWLVQFHPNCGTTLRLPLLC